MDDKEFAEEAKEGINSLPTFQLRARPGIVDPALRLLDPSTIVEYISNGPVSSGVGRIRAGDLVELIQETIDRQTRGLYTLEEVAQILADTLPDLDAEKLLEQMVYAFHAGELTVRSTATQAPLVPGAGLHTFLDWVTPGDIDDLLVKWRVSYRFPTFEGGQVRETPRPLQRQPAQEQAILAKLREHGHDPLRLERAPSGNKPWPLRERVRNELNFSKEVMRKAWTRLRSQRQIQDDPGPTTQGQTGPRHRVE